MQPKGIKQMSDIKTKKNYDINVYIKTTTDFNVPQHMNKILETYKNPQNTKRYIFFIQNDIFANISNKEKLFSKYTKFMQDWNLPYVMYPYYIHINSVLPSLKNIPNPCVEIDTFKGKLNVLNALAYGFLGLDLDKVKMLDFKFDESLKEIFYLQNMMEVYFQKGLAISNSIYLDIKNSWEYFKKHTLDGYKINQEIFNKEKELYYNNKQFQYKNINDSINDVKKIIDSFKPNYP